MSEITLVLQIIWRLRTVSAGPFVIFLRPPAVPEPVKTDAELNAGQETAAVLLHKAALLHPCGQRQGSLIPENGRFIFSPVQKMPAQITADFGTRRIQCQRAQQSFQRLFLPVLPVAAVSDQP